MANATRIKYHGQVLCCLDQTEVKAVEPCQAIHRPKPRNILVRASDWLKAFILGEPLNLKEDSDEKYTKIQFKDGTWIQIDMPFVEFVNEYC